MPDRKAPAVDYDHSPPSHSPYPPRHPPPQHPANTPKQNGRPAPPPPALPPQSHPGPYVKHNASSPTGPPPPSAYQHQAPPPPPIPPVSHHPYPPHQQHPPPVGARRSWGPEDNTSYAPSPRTPTHPGSAVASRRPSQQPSQPPTTGPPTHYQGPSPPHQGSAVHESRPHPPPSPHHAPHGMTAAHEIFSPHEPPPGYHAGMPHHYTQHPPPPHHGPPQGHIDYQQPPPQHQIPYDSYPYSQHAHNPQAVRKQFRATQACEECRKKKSKCDETRPQCNACQSAGIECHYREVQPPKQERSILQVLQAIDDVKQQQQDTTARLDQLMGIFRDSTSAGQHLTNGMHSTPVHAFHSFSGHKLEDGSDHLPTNTPSSTHEDLKPQTNGSGSNLHSTAGIDIDILNGEQSMPKSHSTAAHKLVQHAFIKDFFTGVDPDYIKLDAYRGTINLYDRAHTFAKKGEDVVRGLGSSPGAMSSTSEGAINKSSYGRDSVPWPEPVETKPGQILPLDLARANHFVAIYTECMHVMQPFVDVEKVREMMKTHFVVHHDERAKSSASRSGSPYNGGSDGPPALKKRKGSDGSLPPPHTISVVQLRTPDRTIDVAVMLLVLALGAICDVRQDLSPPLEHPEEWRLVQRALAESNSTTVTKEMDHRLQKPRSDVRTLTSHSLMRSASADGPNTPPNSSAVYSPSSRNIDVVPGLSYYAYAVGILGEQLGGETLPHVQAALLAGLYMGQLARVHESYSWIHRAGTAMQGLLKRSKDVYIKDHFVGGHTTEAQRANEYTIRSYWACHQLESDILAELDNPASGITSEEDKISILFSPQNYSEESILQHYNSMILVRKILNRTHSSLYVEQDNVQLSKSGWTNLKAGDLNRQLEQWRNTLPPSLQWSDDDLTPGSSINDARLRGKYYGAKYIINRPYLLHKLGSNYFKSNAPITQEELENIEIGSAMCIKAAQASTLAFDGVHSSHRRLIVTNIFGTVHAQFGNMLVLAAVMLDKDLSKFIKPDDWRHLIERTVRLFERLSSLSPALTGDTLILKDVQRKVSERTGIPTARSANSSFSDQYTSQSAPTSAR